LHTPKEGLSTPRAEVAGEEMKGLMNAVGSLPSRNLVPDDNEGVAGALFLEEGHPC
jgi:Ras GTPase-activating-like protein IQGAP2/3